MHVAIVGGGPAGAWTAYRLARRGARVTMFDGSHPREKPCGGGVTGRAVDIVREAVAAATLPTVRVRRARFTGADNRDASVDLPAGALAVASRRAFDDALVTAAVREGVTLIPARVVDVDAQRSSGVRISVRTRSGVEAHTADFVVGADGANSLVRRRLAAPFTRRQLSIATGWYAHGVTSDEIVIEMTAHPAGYIWSFPRPDHLAVGICAQADRADGAGLRARAGAWMARSGVGTGARLAPYSWPIPSLGAQEFATLSVAGLRWSLVGDAAGLVDPITREGIFFSLASAEMVADALVATSDWEAVARAYAARVRHEITDDLARAARFKDAFFRPAFSALLVRALRESAGVRAVMADLVAGTQPYRSLKARLLKTFEFGLAWRALRYRPK